MTTLTSDRFTVQSGHRITVQVPETDVNAVITAVTSVDQLIYGDYDNVTFTSQTGTQGFRALGTGRNVATQSVVTVPCVELSFFCAGDAVPLIEAIYGVHPYEEPVIFIAPILRSLHVSGQEEDNPNRFWNRLMPSWVPTEHR